MYAFRSIAVGLLMVAGAAGCGSGSSTPPVAAAPTTSGSPTTSSAAASLTPADDHGVAWAKCMRAHGVDVADPSSNGNGIRLIMPKGQDHQQADAAMNACRKDLPDGGKLIKPDAAVIAQERKMSQCMRENGVPKFPDPEADGGIKLDPRTGVDPTTPAFEKAQAKCNKYAPAGPRHVQAQGGQ